MEAAKSKRGGARIGAGRKRAAEKPQASAPVKVKAKANSNPEPRKESKPANSIKRSGPVPVQGPRLDAVEASIVEDMLAGIGYRAICLKHGVGLQTLVTWVSADAERSRVCAQAREQSARQCDEQAEEELRTAADPFELQRARELATHLRWRAKTRDPKGFGDRVAVDAKIEVSFEDRLLLLSGVVVPAHAFAPEYV